MTRAARVVLNSGRRRQPPALITRYNPYAGEVTDPTTSRSWKRLWIGRKP